MSIPNTTTSTGFKHTFKSLFDVDIPVYTPNSMIIVNTAGTGLEEATRTSIISPVVGTGTANDIPVFTGAAPPILGDSGVSISTSFGVKLIKPLLDADSMRIESTNGAVSLKSVTGSVFIDADQSTGNIDLISASQQMTAYNNISLSANNNLILQAGGGAQIKINSDGSIEINAPAGKDIKIQGNSGGDNWTFSGTATGGNYVMPLTGGLNGSVLTNDGTGNLSWVGGGP